MPNKKKQANQQKQDQQINSGLGLSKAEDLTEEEKLEEEKTSTLNQKSITQFLKQSDQVIGNNSFKRATIIVGDSKMGKSTIANLLLKVDLVSIYDDNIGEYKVR